MGTKRQPRPDLATPAPSRTAGAASGDARAVQRARLERRTLYLLVVMVVAAWLFVVFANALADASAANTLLAQEGRVNASLSARAEAGAVEIEQIQGETFREFLARSYNMGEPAEKPFALSPGAPPPPSMTPLGADDPSTASTTPLEDWMDLLIGS